MGALGLCRTFVFAREVSERGVLEAIRDGRTVVVDSQGHPQGRADLLPLVAGSIAAQPPALPRLRFGGVCAWLGLLGLVIAARRKG
jgi:hypothetical protein